MSESDNPKPGLPWRLVRAGVIGLLIGGVVILFSHLGH